MTCVVDVVNSSEQVSKGIMNGRGTLGFVVRYSFLDIQLLGWVNKCTFIRKCQIYFKIFIFNQNIQSNWQILT